MAKVKTCYNCWYKRYGYAPTWCWTGRPAPPNTTYHCASWKDAENPAAGFWPPSADDEPETREQTEPAEESKPEEPTRRTPRTWRSMAGGMA